MQPYFFPYLGYYQLAMEVDTFVHFDDVAFFKKGYINRNSILLNGEKCDFTISVSNVSQNRNINQHFYVGDFDRFLKTLFLAYKKSPNFKLGYDLVADVLNSGASKVSEVNARSIEAVFSYLGIKKNFAFSSNLGDFDGLRGEDRIIGICKKLGADSYRNAIGGRSFYDQDKFKRYGINIGFVSSGGGQYNQTGSAFVRNLSVIDALMHCEVSEIVSLLSDYTIV